MNVVFVRSGYGQPDSRFEKEISSIIDAGHNVQVIAWDRDSNKDIRHTMHIFGYEVKCLHIGIRSNLAAGFKKNLIPMVRFNTRLFWYLLKTKSDYQIIHASDFDTAVSSYIIKKITKKKLVYDIYDYYADSHHMPQRFKNIVRKLDTRIINNSDAVIVCNEKRKLQIKPAIPKTLYVIHNSPSYSIKKEYSEANDRTNRFRIVFIGGFAKTGRYIFEMINVIRKRPDCELIIGGFGYGADEIEKISQKNENIIYIGKQNYDNVLRIESTADLLTALYDPTLENHKYAAPNKFYEALMLGKPIVCVKNTNIDEIVEAENIGWVLNVPENNFDDEFNNAIDSAIKNKINISEISKREKKLFLERYDWQIMKKRLAEIYSNI